MNTTVKIGAAVLAGVLSVGALSSTAEAASGTLSGNCSTAFKFHATFAAYYNIGSNGRPAFWGFAWNLTPGTLPLGLGLGNKNNVFIVVRKEVPHLRDRTLWYWKSQDSVRAGASLLRLPTPFQVTTTNRVHASAQFTFDIPEDPDSKCTANTPSI